MNYKDIISNLTNDDLYILFSNNKGMDLVKAASNRDKI